GGGGGGQDRPGIPDRPGRNDACGECASCRRMDDGAHLNLLNLAPDEKGVIKIDRIRELQGRLKYRIESGRRVVVVAGAETMLTQAANAFLKTLEEPPASSIIILLSSRPSDLLPTVLSRCQRINFRPLAEDVISGLLAREEGLSREEAAWAARLSGGSISKALKVVETGFRQRRAGLVKRLLALTPADVDEILDMASELSKEEDLLETIEFLKTWFRDRAVTAEGAGHLAVNSDMAALLDAELGAELGPGEGPGSFAFAEEARMNITPPRYANKLLTVETMLLRLAGARAA
ncbi:MAG: hypothetical protein V3W31_07785, partial [Thermodesulfobacteriota bacterium]